MLGEFVASANSSMARTSNPGATRISPSASSRRAKFSTACRAHAATPARRPNSARRRERIAGVRNPTVVRVQNEMRKVVNNLIGLYGKPDLIRVELRATSASRSASAKKWRGDARREVLRKRARADLIANGLPDPNDDDIEKWLLWTESGERCPYTGDEIGFDGPFQRQSALRGRAHLAALEITRQFAAQQDAMPQGREHRQRQSHPVRIFPWAARRLAGGEGSRRKMTGKDRMTEGKAKRFCAEAMPDDFANRQLNDTGYAARQAMAFLKRLWPDVGSTAPVNVQAVTGKVTAQLRRRWGLNHILADDGEKTRDDHRHHAIDALVVACADGGYTQKLSHYLEAESDYERGRGVRPDEAMVPRPGRRPGRCEARRGRGSSYRIACARRFPGRFIWRRPTATPASTPRPRSGTYRLFVTRKPVERLSKSELARHRGLSGAPRRRDRLGRGARRRSEEGVRGSLPARRRERATSSESPAAKQAAAFADGACVDGLRRSRTELSRRDLSGRRGRSVL